MTGLNKLGMLDTIVNCFKHCEVQLRTDEVTDPFADLDEESEDEESEDEG